MSQPPYRVELSPAAGRELRRLPIRDAAALRDPILALGLEPRPFGAVKLAGTDQWRIRVGPLRVVYAIDAMAGVVIVLRVARRSEATYRGLRESPEPYGER